MQNYDYSNFPATSNAGKYANWVPGQEAPRQPGFSDWFFNGVMTPFLSGFYTDSVAFADTDSFAKQVGERAQWQARKDAIDKAMREHLPGKGPFAPKTSVPQSTPKSSPRPAAPKQNLPKPRPKPPAPRPPAPKPSSPAQEQPKRGFPVNKNSDRGFKPLSARQQAEAALKAKKAK